MVNTVCYCIMLSSYPADKAPNPLSPKRSFFCRRKAAPPKGAWDEDEDVVAERRRVDTGAADTDVLQLSQLTKIYQHLNRKVQAVKRLSVGIPAGEVRVL